MMRGGKLRQRGKVRRRVLRDGSIKVNGAVYFTKLDPGAIIEVTPFDYSVECVLVVQDGRRHVLFPEEMYIASNNQEHIKRGMNRQRLNAEKK
jgi:hypothetical protein